MTAPYFDPETLASIRENLATVQTASKNIEEKLTGLLQGVVDPEARKLIKKTLRGLRRGRGEVNA